VVGAKHPLTDRQRPLELHPRAGQIPKVMQHTAEAVTPARHVRVVGAKRRLTDRQRPLELHLRARQVPKSPQHAPKLVAAPSDLRVRQAQGPPR